MRKVALLSLVAVLAACGGSSSSGSSALSGTIGGTPFTASTELALFGTGNACNISLAAGIPLGVSMAVTGLTSATTTCTEALTCVTHKNSQVVSLIIAKANLTTGTAPGLAVGTYQFIDLATLATNPPTFAPDSNGNIAIFIADVTGLNATCLPTPTAGYTVTSGSLNVTAVTATSVTGTVSLTLGNGQGSVSGTFTASGCGVPAFDACAALNGITSGGGLDTCTGTPTCI